MAFRFQRADGLRERLSCVLMDAHENTPRMQVLSVSDTGRRRRWTDDEKIRIIEESYRDGASLTEVTQTMPMTHKSAHRIISLYADA